MRVCPSCGHQNADDVDFCANCGQYVRWEPTRVGPTVKSAEQGAVAAPAPPAAPPGQAPPAGDGGAPPPAPPPPAPAGQPPPAAPPPPGMPPPAVPAAPPPPAPEIPPESVLLAPRLPDQEGAPGEPVTVQVDPGGQASMLVLVRNQSEIVDNYDIAIAGIPDHWWTVYPPTVYLVPYGTSEQGFEQEVEIRFHPPRAPESEARPWPMAVTAYSRAHNVQIAQADATLVIAPYQEIDSEMRPERKAGRRRGRFAVAVRNRANAPVNVGVSAVDAENKVQFQFEHPQFPTRPGRRSGTIFWVTPLKQIWIGRKVDHRFTLDAKTIGYDAAAIPKMGVFVQKPWLPYWLLILLPLLIVAAILLYLLWPRTVKVPNVRQCDDVACAQRLLDSKDLKLGEQTEVKTELRDPGSPIGSSPGTGKEVKKGTVVDIRVAIATGPPRFEVPNVVGMTFQDADAALKKAKLTKGQLTPQPDSPTAEVTGQVPKAGDLAAEGTPVDLFFEKAVPPTTTDTNGGGPTTQTNGEGNGGTGPPPPPPPDPNKPLTPQQLAQFLILFDNGKNVIAMPANDGKPIRGLFRTREIESEATFFQAQDGSLKVAFRKGDDAKGQIFVADPRQPRFTQAVTNAGFDDGRPAFSPDGRVIAFIRPAQEKDAETGLTDADLCFVSATARAARPRCVVDPENIVSRPTWSPDGRSILVISRPNVTGADFQIELELYTSAQPNSANDASWTSQGLATDEMHGDRPGEFVFHAAWSPDGEQVAISANWNSRSAHLFLVKADQENAQLSDATEFQRIRACELSWRPDSRGLAIVQRDNLCSRSGNIVRYDLATPAEVFPLTNLRLGAETPVWAPVFSAG